MKGLAQELSERGSKKGALKAVKSCRKKQKSTFLARPRKHKKVKKIKKSPETNQTETIVNLKGLDLILPQLNI